ncbi:MAG: glycosyltransferase [Spirochaetaceae bacterium]|nr:glycosyltransferase [Spirochaetaceae bacterium]
MPVGNERGDAADRGNGRLRATCSIAGLGQGGAQRQMSMLAALLARREHDIDVLTYRPSHFFDPVVQAAGVPTRRLPPSGKLQRARAVSRALGDRQPDVVIAYLSGPGVYAELANLPRRRFGLIVSEFTVPHDTVRPAHRLRLAPVCWRARPSLPDRVGERPACRKPGAVAETNAERVGDRDLRERARGAERHRLPSTAWPSSCSTRWPGRPGAG